MKERPILFSAPMVRALRAGTKTQTRRVIKPAPKLVAGVWYFYRRDCPVYLPHVEVADCPYGIPGDRLWVREAFSGSREFAPEPPSAWGPNDPIWYWADGNPTAGDWTKPRPSIHMPRLFSRTLLEITEVRAERLQSISEADAAAEGVASWAADALSPHGQKHLTPVEQYEHLWTQINGAESWKSNPWVWVVSFRVIP